MKTIWLDGLSDEKKVEMRRDFVGSSLLREHLSKILENKVENARSRARAACTYENPNWAYLQADTIGYERALYEVISLIEK